MSKPFNNKILLIVFLVLAMIFIVNKAFLSKRSSKTLKTELVAIDTSRITEILVYPRSDDFNEIRFRKEAGVWVVSKGDIAAEADQMGIIRLLDELLNLKTDRRIVIFILFGIRLQIPPDIRILFFEQRYHSIFKHWGDSRINDH